MDNNKLVEELAGELTRFAWECSRTLTTIPFDEVRSRMAGMVRRAILEARLDEHRRVCLENVFDCRRAAELKRELEGTR